MQRLNRSARAPKGSAFLLVLGLAIVPLSLRAAGLQVSFNPSLSAATEAWQQIADVFGGAGYRPAVVSDVAMPIDLNRGTLKAADDSACPSREIAFCREIGQESRNAQDVCKAPAVNSCVRGKFPIAAPRSSASIRVAEASVAAAAMVQSAAESAVIHDELQKNTRAFEAMSAVKLDTLTREDLLKNIDRRIAERSFETRKILRIPQDVRIFVRVNPPVTPSATRSAETKVRAALASARRLELERACMNTALPAGPDNGEL